MDLPKSADVVVIGGGVKEILENLGHSIISHTVRKGLVRENPVSVSRAAGGGNAVASGAAYAALKFLLASLSFPIYLPVTKK